MVCRACPHRPYFLMAHPSHPSPVINCDFWELRFFCFFFFPSRAFAFFICKIGYVNFLGMQLPRFTELCLWNLGTVLPPLPSPTPLAPISGFTSSIQVCLWVTPCIYVSLLSSVGILSQFKLQPCLAELMMPLNSSLLPVFSSGESIFSLANN